MRSFMSGTRERPPASFSNAVSRRKTYSEVLSREEARGLGWDARRSSSSFSFPGGNRQSSHAGKTPEAFTRVVSWAYSVSGHACGNRFVRPIPELITLVNGGGDGEAGKPGPLSPRRLAIVTHFSIPINPTERWLPGLGI